MNTGWRPKDWDYTYKDVPSGLPIFDPHSLCDPTIFEAGASAMLGKLMAIGERLECIDQWDKERPFTTGMGWLIFIPNEEG